MKNGFLQHKFGLRLSTAVRGGCNTFDNPAFWALYKKDECEHICDTDNRCRILGDAWNSGSFTEAQKKTFETNTKICKDYWCSSLK